MGYERVGPGRARGRLRAVGRLRARHRRAVTREPVRGRRALRALHAIDQGHGTVGRRFLRRRRECSGSGSWLRTPGRGRTPPTVDGPLARRPERHLRVHAARTGEPRPGRRGRSFHFAYGTARGSCRLGTTALCLDAPAEALQEATLATLARSPFTKLRMCVFPKSYLFNTNEPDLYPFARDRRRRLGLHPFRPGVLPAPGAADRAAHRARHRGRPDPLPPVRPLGLLGHGPGRRRPVPALPGPAAGRAPRRLVVAGQRVRPAVVEDGRGLGAPRGSRPPERPRGPPHSIHNCFGFYDHARPWITHCSIQRTDVYRTAENTDGMAGGRTASRSSSTSAATKATSTRAGATSAARSWCAASGKGRCAAAMSGTARPT